MWVVVPFPVSAGLQADTARNVLLIALFSCRLTGRISYALMPWCKGGDRILKFGSTVLCMNKWNSFLSLV